MNKKTIVLGASTNTDRYSYKAVGKLVENNYEVVPIGIKKGSIFSLDIINEPKLISNVHTVSLYIGKDIQNQWKEYIFLIKPKRVIFNPGTENEEFEQELNAKGIETIEACTLVMLSIGNY